MKAHWEAGTILLAPLAGGSFSLRLSTTFGHARGGLFRDDYQIEDRAKGPRRKPLERPRPPYAAAVTWAT
jgi:hypothetical protein